MPADKTAFHRSHKKKGQFGKVFKNLWQKNHQSENNYLPDLSNIYIYIYIYIYIAVICLLPLKFCVT